MAVEVVDVEWLLSFLFIVTRAANRRCNLEVLDIGCHVHNTIMFVSQPSLAGQLPGHNCHVQPSPPLCSLMDTIAMSSEVSLQATGHELLKLKLFLLDAKFLPLFSHAFCS